MALIPIYLYLIALYVRPQDWVPFFLNWPTAYILVPLGMVVATVSYTKEREAFQLPQNWLLPLYLAIIFLSTWLATDNATAFGQFEMFLKRIAVFFMIAWTLTTRERLQRVIVVMLGLSLFLAYQAFLQATEGQAWGGQTPYPGYTETRVRWYGDWDGPNVFGILFVIAVAFTLELLLGPHSFFMRLAAIGLGVSYLAAIHLTNSRGAVLAVGCSVLFYFKDKFRHIMAVVVGAAAVLALFAFGPSRLDQVSSSESSAHERTWLWEQGLHLLRENPILGVGRGQFIERVDLRLLSHSNYVQNFSETGLLGFFCFMAILWFCFKGNLLVSKPEYGSDPGLVALARMMTSAIVGYAAVTFFVVMELDLFYFMLGLAAAVYLVARRENPRLPALSFTRRDAVVVFGGMAGLIVMIWLIAVTEFL